MNGSRRGGGCRVAAAAAIAAALLTAGCLEAPVEERLDIRFLPGGGAVLSSDVRLRPASDFEKSPAAADRIRATSEEVRTERDAWTTRLRAASPDRERLVIERAGGDVRRAVRHVHVPDAGEVERVFDGTGVRARYRTGEGWAELALAADSGGNATAAEGRELEKRLDAWIPKVVAYLGACRVLWEHLEANPERAHPCFRALMGGPDPDDERPAEPLTDREKAWVDAVGSTGDGLLEVLAMRPEDAYSTDELSRRVHDPFPAPMRIQVPGKVLEREGFEGEGGLEIRSRTLWNAWRSLEGSFLEPDPMVAAWEQDRAGKKTFDLDAFVARPRRAASPPSDRELRAAFAKALAGPATYRVRWSTRETGSEAVADPFEQEP